MSVDKDKEELKMVSDFIADLADVVPRVVKGILEGLFSEETGISLGKGVGGFYKGLVDAGVPPENALAMANEYLGALTRWPEVLKSLEGMKGIHIGDETGLDSEEIRELVREQIEEALKKKEETST